MANIAFYHLPSGRCPVEEFLDGLESKQAKKVTWVLRLITEMDPVPSQYWKKLGNTDDIWEVRVNFGGDTFRLLGFYAHKNLVILTNGFRKKSQKTPKTEIRVAEQRKQHYEKESR